MKRFVLALVALAAFAAAAPAHYRSPDLAPAPAPFTPAEAGSLAADYESGLALVSAEVAKPATAPAPAHYRPVANFLLRAPVRTAAAVVVSKVKDRRAARRFVPPAAVVPKAAECPGGVCPKKD